MIEFKGVGQPRIDISADYQISIIEISTEPLEENKFLKKLTTKAAKEAEGIHNTNIDGIDVKYHKLLKSLSVNLKNKNHHGR